MILCIFHMNSSHMKFIYTFFQKFCHKSSNFQLYIFRTISNLALFFIFYRIVTTKKAPKIGALNCCYYLLSLSSRALSSSYIIAGTRSPTYFVLLNLGFSFAFEFFWFFRFSFVRRVLVYIQAHA